MLNRLFWCALFVLATGHVEAGERATVCAKYRTEYGWSNGYQVVATIQTGNELNQATRSFSYTSYSTYVVIFWDKGQASVIEMSFPYLGPIGQEGEDQQGRKWEIAKTSICF